MPRSFPAILFVLLLGTACDGYDPLGNFALCDANEDPHACGCCFLTPDRHEVHCPPLTTPPTADVHTLPACTHDGGADDAGAP